jgi:hypothetical protein
LGAIPAPGVDAERCEAAGVEGAAAGDDGDGVVAGVEGDAPDALQRVEAATGGEVLVVDVGVAHILRGEVGGDERFDDRGDDADQTVSSPLLVSGASVPACYSAPQRGTVAGGGEYCQECREDHARFRVFNPDDGATTLLIVPGDGDGVFDLGDDNVPFTGPRVGLRSVAVLVGSPGRARERCNPDLRPKNHVRRRASVGRACRTAEHSSRSCGIRPSGRVIDDAPAAQGEHKRRCRQRYVLGHVRGRVDAVRS